MKVFHVEAGGSHGTSGSETKDFIQWTSGSMCFEFALVFLALNPMEVIWSSLGVLCTNRGFVSQLRNFNLRDPPKIVKANLHKGRHLLYYPGHQTNLFPSE